MRPEEAARVTLAYQMALAYLGVRVAASAARLWSRLNPSRIAESSGPWLDEVVDLVMDARVAAYELAVAYYRLHRALLTGETVRAPGGGSGSVELGRLRAEFLELLPGEMPQRFRYSPPAGGGRNRIPVSPQVVFDRAQTARREREARAEARSALENLGPRNLERQVKKLITDDVPAAEVERQREEAFEKAGRRQAASAERIAMNGARGAVADATDRDRRVIGYIRLSRTGTPCGWCAMLISRGPVYKSRRSATRSWVDGKLYHDNCKCVAEPIYSMEQYRANPIYELNRRYAEEWPKVTKGYSGKDAVRVWRRHIRRQQRAQATAARAAQGAAPST